MEVGLWGVYICGLAVRSYTHELLCLIVNGDDCELFTKLFIQIIRDSKQ